MKKILSIKGILVLSLIFIVTSCTKDFEDMNVNPNEPVDAPSTNILAHSIRYMAGNFYDDWMDMNNFLSYSGMVTKIQYIDEARYQFRESVVNAAWDDVYNTLLDLQKVVMKADEAGNKNMKAVAMTFQVWIWQIATDMWKSIPYSEALSGEEGITNPVYDSQKDIYMGLFDKIKAAGDLFAEGATDDIGDGDLIFNGDVAKWQKFCNSLRLRLAIRVSNKDAALAKQHFEAVIGDQNTYPIMESIDDNVLLWWPGVPPYEEPWAQNRTTDNRDDHGMCETLIDTLKKYNDPRLPVYAQPAYYDTVGGVPVPVYRGIDNGTVDGSFAMDTISRIGEYYRLNLAGFTPFMRYSEIQFIIAEGALNGWNTGGVTAEQAYTAGITASMNENGITDQTAIDDYIAGNCVAWDGTARLIHIQKWLALFKQGHEAWSEMRRTDIPLVPVAAGTSYTGHNRQPFRYPYPTVEWNLNSANITPAAQGIIDHFWGQQMWWDTRTGVQ